MNAPLPAPQLAPRPAAARLTSTRSAAADLPPSARPRSAAASWLPRWELAGRSTRAWAAAALLAVAGAAVLLFGTNGDNESSWRAWRHHRQAAEQFQEKGHRPAGLQPAVKWITATGSASFQAAVPLTALDGDAATTRSVLAAMQRYDLRAAQAAVEQAQTGPASGPISASDSPARPSLSQGMLDEIRRGDARFYHIFLFDSCDEDGDVVDLVIDGHRFATVPITRAGTTLSIPLGGGRPTSVVVRGVHDGGGGITVACQTSRGEGFVRPLQPGEEQPLAFVVE